MIDEGEPGGPRKLTPAQARIEQRLYWEGKSMAERFAASRALMERMYRLRGINLDALRTNLNPRLVSRRRG